MAEELLKEQLKLLKKISSPKESHQLIFNSDNSKIKKNFRESLELSEEKYYEIALINLETYYSFPNITEKNNIIDYYKISTQELKRIIIPKGCYEFEKIVEEIYNQLKNNGDQEAIEITVNTSTFKSIIKVKSNYKIRFPEKSLKTVLGFTEEVYDEGIHISENIVNINPIVSIYVHINLISGSYVDGLKQAIIYSFYPTVPPGYKISQTPSKPIYLPVCRRYISDIFIKLTDQDNNLLDLNGEKLVLRFHIREK